MRSGVTLLAISCFMLRIHSTDSSICPPGKYNLTKSNFTVCDSCKSGTYAEVRGATTCKNCTAGKFSTSIAASSSSACTPCPLGSDSGPGSSSIENCTCNPGYSGANGTCTMCPAGTYKQAQGTASCLDCGYGSNSTKAAENCFCLPGFQKTNRSVVQYDPGAICTDPDCPLTGTYTASSGLLCRQNYRNSETAYWIVMPTAPHAGLLFTFLKFETELQHDFVAVYSCLDLACCRTDTADSPDPACLRSTPIVISGKMRTDDNAPPDICNVLPLVSTRTNPVEEMTLMHISFPASLPPSLRSFHPPILPSSLPPSLRPALIPPGFTSLRTVATKACTMASDKAKTVRTNNGLHASLSLHLPLLLHWTHVIHFKRN
jgi:hypothetical protein